MSTVVLSPHLDDAVLSCWHVLTRSEPVVVINVFAGVPTGLHQPAWWDSYTGATDSAQRMRERIEEDRIALGFAGRTAVNLDLLDEQYREAQLSPATICKRLGRLLGPEPHVYAPAAFLNHADHVLVRAAALELRSRGAQVSLYADLPHATVHGWPAWVTRSRDTPSKDLAAVLWDRVLVATGIAPDAMTPSVHEFDDDARACKLAAVHAYRTQLPGLAELAGNDLADREALGYEVVWSLLNASRNPPARASDVPRDRAALRPAPR